MSFNRKIIHALMVLTILFLTLVGYLTYFQVVRAPKLATSGKNPRTLLNEQKIQRGDILSSDGTVLAYSEMSDGSQVRVYPFDNLYSHVIGYNNSTYGRAMLEDSFNGYIMGQSGTNELMNFGRFMTNTEKRGADLLLTIDHKLQKKAYDLLGDNKGSVVALDPRTGATLALVSKPDFNPNAKSLSENWEEISNSGDSPFLPRATKGLYPPGSSFKIITATAAVEAGISEKTFEDTGVAVINGTEFKNYDEKVLGKIDINTAFAKSSNTVFVNLAAEVGRGKLRDLAEKFKITTEYTYDIPVADGSGLAVPDKTNTAACGMGQGDLLVTPMNMALVGCAVANGGKIMEPYIVQSADLVTGENIYTHSDEVLSEVMEENVAKRVSQMMAECVKRGTGTGAAISGVQVAGKTGTAENSGADHAWFVAFAPIENPEIVVCAMVENADDTGGSTCAPMVREIISQWLKK